MDPSCLVDIWSCARWGGCKEGSTTDSKGAVCLKLSAKQTVLEMRHEVQFIIQTFFVGKDFSLGRKRHQHLIVFLMAIYFDRLKMNVETISIIVAK